MRPKLEQLHAESLRWKRWGGQGLSRLLLSRDLTTAEAEWIELVLVVLGVLCKWCW